MRGTLSKSNDFLSMGGTLKGIVAGNSSSSIIEEIIVNSGSMISLSNSLSLTPLIGGGKNRSGSQIKGLGLRGGTNPINVQRVNPGKL